MTKRITARATTAGQPGKEGPRWWWLALLVGCGPCGEPTREEGAPPPTVEVTPVEPPPIEAPPIERGEPVEPQVMPEPRCPPDMVKVTPREPPGDEDPTRAYCIDRYESMLVDSQSGARISPYYAPSRRQARSAAQMWESKRFEMGSPSAQTVPLPTLPAWQLQRDFEPRAVSRKGVTPNGHVSGEQAQTACRHAGKRLCTPAEWRIACGGPQGWNFPYGPDYVQGACNVFREAHPAAELHDDASIGHSDPRLNRVTKNGRPLLRKTGASPDCKSEWDGDVIYDMVGNLDEWLADPEGSFAGGFYARASKSGCDWRADGHSFHYADYSTGLRCCADLPSPTPIR